MFSWSFNGSRGRKEKDKVWSWRRIKRLGRLKLISSIKVNSVRTNVTFQEGKHKRFLSNYANEKKSMDFFSIHSN